MTVHALIKRLRDAGIYFELTTVRDDAVMFRVAVPGERWEIELFSDEHAEIEVFTSTGAIFDSPKLDDLFSRFTD